MAYNSSISDYDNPAGKISKTLNVPAWSALSTVRIHDFGIAIIKIFFLKIK